MPQVQKDGGEAKHFLKLFLFSVATLASYSASSALLAALSEYQYTRKAWRKEALDLFLDSAFFQTDLDGLKRCSCSYLLNEHTLYFFTY